MTEDQYIRQLRELWNKNWPDSMPKEPIYPFGQILMTDYLQKWAEVVPDKPCIIYYGSELTFKQLDDLSDRFASLLSSRGLKKGDRVAVYLPNCPQFHIAFFGILKLGCIHVPVNPMFKEQELIYELNDTQAKLIVALDQLFPIVQAAQEQTCIQDIVTTNIAEFIPTNPTIPVHSSLLTPKQECPGVRSI
jgi:long-chain acyl-CoA synthetase